MRKVILIFLFPLAVLCSSWGFFAHKQINRMAVFTLPQGIIGFYKRNIDFITERAVDPDKRRYSDSLEAPRHFLDADHYGELPFNKIPRKWNDAVFQYSADSLKAYGILPWHIQKTYYALVEAFENRDSAKVIRLSSDLGHYLGDAHVPLHTTENYNGQLTNQVGIHAFWESRLPELFSHRYDFFVGKAEYIDDPLKEAWGIVQNTFRYKDSVLLIEARINKSYSSSLKYTYSQRNGRVEKQYSEEYSKKYHDALSGMVERQMRSSILKIGSFWYSAWVDAGQPAMNSFKKRLISVGGKRRTEQADQQPAERKILGREEN